MADKLAMPDKQKLPSEQQAKRISERLANKVRARDTTSPEFQADLQKYDAFRRQQISQGKATRAGKNSALITPFLDALPQEQRALGLHISTEVAASAEDIKEHVTAEMQKWQCRPGEVLAGQLEANHGKTMEILMGIGGLLKEASYDRMEVDALAREVQQNTQPRPGQLQMMVDLSAPSVSIPTLNAMLLKAQIACKGSKVQKAKCLVEKLPVHELQKLLAEAMNPPADPEATDTRSSTAGTSSRKEDKAAFNGNVGCGTKRRLANGGLTCCAQRTSKILSVSTFRHG